MKYGDKRGKAVCELTGNQLSQQKKKGKKLLGRSNFKNNLEIIHSITSYVRQKALEKLPFSGAPRLP